MKYGLNDSTIEQACRILAHYPQVQKAVLYGSRARGNCKIGSDIDLTLIGGDDLNLAVLGKIMDELDDLLLPYTFDLSLFSLIGDPEVREEIQRTGMVFYQRRNDA
ncbi:nucleotidyltransferase domain-containing protein [Roseiflexus sp.]|uniref:nucleotidyltransferase domain-containing protein n=1 Tax=Roseiflexus sp. TaxID=2562120 RepID=UPI0021DC67BF|nr:nucleotidyltransferase domain-containing protein [Roseiflexus sp.]GIW00158.1 MAG: hypothetical protein KatS3mg058_1561 [Roseiflexus sp.]